jgi:3-oxoacyl-[acyl-carrier-protein] synthase III
LLRPKQRLHNPIANTAILFGDGAGAVILEGSEETGILHSKLFSDGNYLSLLAAMSAKSQVDSLVTMRLSLIPVREVIHSSEVSSVLDKSSLVTIFGGKSWTI